MPTTTPAMRERYLGDTVATASPAKLLLMLYDRLVLDLSRAEQAIQDGDRAETNRQLVHAQQIVLELNLSLKPELWSGGPGLASLYVFLHRELVNANLNADAGSVATCRGMVETLRDAWRGAAVAAATAAG